MCSSNLRARLGQDRGRNEVDGLLTMRKSLIARALIPIWVTAKMARRTGMVEQGEVKPEQVQAWPGREDA